MKKSIILIIGFLCLVSNIAFGLWSISQDKQTQGAGNVGYTGFVSLPLYLTTSARDNAIRNNGDEKYRTYGSYIQYGITDQLDVGLHGNSSVNASIGVNIKYRAVDIMSELMLSPFGTLIGGVDLSKNFSVYGGVKAFNWSNMYLNQQTRKNVFGSTVFAGLHIYRKDGWNDRRVASFLPLGLYLELGYPMIKSESQVITLTLGLDGFLGLSFPRLQWNY